jgi:hypothetical protein
MCQRYTATLFNKGTRTFKEKRFKVLDQFGTADLVLIHGDHADLVDYKFGWRQVDDADINPQAQAYTLGLWDEFPEVRYVTTHLLMPRLGVISKHTYDRVKDYDQIKLRIIAIVEAAKRSDPTSFRPHAETCEYCGKKGTCPALAKKAIELGEKIGTDLEWPADVDPANVRDPMTRNLLLRMAPVMEKWCEQIRKEALRLSLEEGLEIPGFRRLTRALPRKVTSIPGAWDTLKDTLSIETFLACCTNISVPELENAFAEGCPRGQKTKAKQALENRLRDASVMAEEGSVFYLKQENKKQENI